MLGFVEGDLHPGHGGQLIPGKVGEEIVREGRADPKRFKVGLRRY